MEQTCPINRTQSTSDVMTAYFDCIAKGDFAKLGTLISDNVVWHQPGKGALSKTYFGKEAVFALFGQFMEISQGSFKIDRVDSIMCNGNYAAATLHFSANRVGHSISMSGVDLMRIENGQIQEVFLFSSDQAAEDSFWGRAH